METLSSNICWLLVSKIFPNLALCIRFKSYVTRSMPRGYLCTHPTLRIANPPLLRATRRLQAVPSLGPWERSRPWFAGDYKGAVEEEREARQARAVTAPAWLLTRTRRRKTRA